MSYKFSHKEKWSGKFGFNHQSFINLSMARHSFNGQRFHKFISHEIKSYNKTVFFKRCSPGFYTVNRARKLSAKARSTGGSLLHFWRQFSRVDGGVLWQVKIIVSVTFKCIKASPFPSLWCVSEISVNINIIFKKFIISKTENCIITHMITLWVS